ncbi:MAG: hypothetical protein QOG54_221 [Actinomycetota bacterium]|nr:hypothetical protein [Actinomycetota bacterium]
MEKNGGGWMAELERVAPNDVSLREVRDDDLDAFFEDQADPDAARMAALPSRDRAAHFAHWTKILADETVITKTVVVDGDVAGNVVSWEHDSRRLIGYWIGRAHWGRGIATAALSRFIEVIDELPLHAFVATSNVGSIRVLEKCGFRPSGSPTTGDDGIEEVLMELSKK